MLIKFDFFSAILRAADGAVGGLVAAAGGGDPAPPAAAAGSPAAGGADAAAGGAAAPGAATADPAKPADGAAAAPPAPYVPDGLPDTFKGGNERETIDKLWGHFKSTQPPPKPDDYAFTVTKEIEGLIDPKNDPVLPMWREVAHEVGMSQEMFNATVPKLFAKMTAAGLIEKPIDVDAEFAALSTGKGDPSAQIAEGRRVAQELGGQINALATRGVITKEAAAELAGPMLANAKQFRAMGELVAALNKGGGLQPGPAAGGGDAANDEQARLARMYPSMAPKT